MKTPYYPLSYSVEDFYNSFEFSAENSPCISNNINFITDDVTRFFIYEICNDLLQYTESPELKEDYVHTFVFIYSDPDKILEYYKKILPEKKEISVFISYNKVGDTSGVIAHFNIGEEVKLLLAKYINYRTRSSISNYLTYFNSYVTDSEISEIISSGKLTNKSLDEVTGFLQFIQIVNLAFIPLDIISEYITGTDFSTVETNYENYGETELAGLLSKICISETTLNEQDFKNIAEGFIQKLVFDSTAYLNVLPSEEFAVVFIFNELYDYFRDNAFVQFYLATKLFQAALLASVATSTVSDISRLANKIEENKLKYAELTLGAAVVGNIAFSVGTVWQIICDIFYTFYQLLYYAWQGIKYLWNTVFTEKLKPADDLLEADDSALNSLFPPFDCKEFLDMAPELIRELKSLLQNIIEIFILNAEKFGSSVGEYVSNMIDENITESLQNYLTEFDTNWSISEKITYVWSSYYNLGKMIGPIIIDVILFVCTGGESGVIKAGIYSIDQLGSIKKIGEILKFTERIAVIKKLEIYHLLEPVVLRSERLIDIIQQLFEKLWASLGSPLDQVKSLIGWMEKSLPDNLKKVANKLANTKVLDDIYDQAQLVELFVGILILFSGTGEINEEGKIVIA